MDRLDEAKKCAVVIVLGQSLPKWKRSNYRGFLGSSKGEIIMRAFSKWIFRQHRVLRMAFLVMFLGVQLPGTLRELPRLGTARYFSEVESGLRAAAAEAWRGR